MPHADLNGLEIHYDVHGEGDPLVCVHGLGCDRRAWVMQIQPFSQQYKTVLFDNRDVGQSSLAPGDYSTADMADDVLALADHLELPGFHLLGISLGGMVSQQVALKAPERVRTLTLAVTHGGVQKAGRLRGHLLGSYARHLSPEDQVDNLLYLCYTEAFFENDEMYAFMKNALLENPYPQPPEAFARQAAAGAHHDVRDRLAELTMPVHVIGAERDLMIPVWKSRELASLIPGSKLTIIDGQGHGVMWEGAEEFNAAVTEFLASTPTEAIR
ncbi:MAG TPA: alpha/beta fold hydrolase [Thermoleophilaceae bacterium]